MSSSLHRKIGIASKEKTLRESEISLIDPAHKWGLGITRVGLVDDLQLLADLQHFGIATRLIDVISEPMTALWFACQQPSKEGVIKDGLVIAINITKMQQKNDFIQFDGIFRLTF